MAKSTIKPNHMSINWHDYTGHTEDEPITQASLTVKGSLIGRVGLMLLSCGTGAWRVRSSMNSMAEYLGVTCTSGIGLTTIDYTCFEGYRVVGRIFNHMIKYFPCETTNIIFYRDMIRRKSS